MKKNQYGALEIKLIRTSFEIKRIFSGRVLGIFNFSSSSRLIFNTSFRINIHS